MKALLQLAIVAIVAVAGYHYRAEIGQAAWLIKDQYFSPAPCTEPIKYSLGTFDQGFGITRAQFLADIATAGKLWTDADGRELFQYNPTGDSKDILAARELKINLIYDYRQRATSQMQVLGDTIKDNLTTYDAAKARYDALEAAYKTKKAQLDSLTAQYNQHKQEYEAEVAYWNARGGAPKQEFTQIEAQRQTLNAESIRINQVVAELNAMVANLNAAGKSLNGLATNLNSTVKTYNKVGESTGPEFDEGEYVEDATGKYINIYQFATNDMLTRVLAHELGHALGLDHVEDPQGIMYRLNSSKGTKLTAADITELKRVCKE